MIIPLSTAIIVSNALAGTIDRSQNEAHLQLLNKYRKDNGKTELVFDKYLMAAAEIRVQEQVLFWGHSRPTEVSIGYQDYYTSFTTPANDKNVYYASYAENLAVWGTDAAGYLGYKFSAEDAINGWKTSTGHNQNMLDLDKSNNPKGVSSTAVGIAHYKADDGREFWVQIFGTPTDGWKPNLDTVKIDENNDFYGKNEKTNTIKTTDGVILDTQSNKEIYTGSTYSTNGFPQGYNPPTPPYLNSQQSGNNTTSDGGTNTNNNQNQNNNNNNNTNTGGGSQSGSEQQPQTQPSGGNTDSGNGNTQQPSTPTTPSGNGGNQSTGGNQNQNAGNNQGSTGGSGSNTNTNNNTSTDTNTNKPTQKPSTDKEESKEENKPTTPSKPSQSEKDKAEQEKQEAQKAEQERLEAEEKARQEAEQKAAEEKAKQEAEQKAKEEAMKAVVVAMMAEEIRQSNPQFKALSEGAISAVTTVLAAADTAATSGMDEASKATSANAATLGAGQTAMAAFGATGGGSMRYKSGSHVDVKGVNVLAGVGFSREFNEGKIMIAPFVEAGWSKYNTYNSFNNAASVEGDGDSSFVGFGALLRYDISGASHPYIEASVRAGELKNKYNAGSVYDRLGRVLEYTTHTPYFSAHVGAGYIFDLGDGLSLDLGAKYLYTHVKSDKVNVAGDKFSFGAVNSHRLRASAKVEKELNENVSVYGGMAYEYEFKGSANASINGRTIKAPSIKGGSGMAEVGFGWYLTKNVRLDISAQGWVGKKQGVNGNIGIKINF